jgi:CRISPR/Cas system-associated endoribonuclease Cas2
LIRNQQKILYPYKKDSVIAKLITDIEDMIDTQVRPYLAVYGNGYRDWIRVNKQRREDSDPHFYGDVMAVQKLQKECPFIDDAVRGFKDTQLAFRNLDCYLQKQLNSVEPSDFQIEIEKKKLEKLENRISCGERIKGISISAEELHSDQKKDTLVSQTNSKTKHFAVKLGIFSGGVSKTSSTESLGVPSPTLHYPSNTTITKSISHSIL